MRPDNPTLLQILTAGGEVCFKNGVMFSVLENKNKKFSVKRIGNSSLREEYVINESNLKIALDKHVKEL